MNYLNETGLQYFWRKIKDYVAENAGSGGGTSGDYLPLTGGTMTGEIVSTSSMILSSEGPRYDLSITQGSGIVMNGGGNGTGYTQISPGTVVLEGTADNRLQISGSGIRRMNPAGSNSSVWNTNGGVTTFKTINNQSIIGSGNISLSTGGDTVPLELWAKAPGGYTNISDQSEAPTGFVGIPFLRPEGLTGDNNGVALIGEDSSESKEYFTIKAYSGNVPSGSVTYNGPAIVARFESDQFKKDIHAANIPYVGGTYEFPCIYGGTTKATVGLGTEDDVHDLNVQLYEGAEEFESPVAGIYAHLHTPLWLTFVSYDYTQSNVLCSAYGAAGLEIGKNRGSLGYSVTPQSTYVSITANGIDISDPTPNTDIDASWAESNFANVFDAPGYMTCVGTRILDIDYENKIAIIRYTINTVMTPSNGGILVSLGSQVLTGTGINNDNIAAVVVSVPYTATGAVKLTTKYTLALND